MVTVTEFTVPADAFPLGRVFERVSGVSVELERVVPTGSGLVPYVWVRGMTEDEVETVERTARRHADVGRVEFLDSVDGEYLLRIEWGADYQGILRGIADMDGVLVSGTGTAEGWTFEVRSDTRDAIAGFQRYCRDHDVPITVTAVRALTDIGGETARDLTAAQREALVLAYERGYFRSPRETSLDALASELGITAQAFGGRLRRGTHRLVASTLIGSEG